MVPIKKNKIKICGGSKVVLNGFIHKCLLHKYQIFFSSPNEFISEGVWNCFKTIQLTVAITNGLQRKRIAKDPDSTEYFTVNL